MRIEIVLCVLSLIVLTTSRTVQWTNAGGNPQWEYAANWDCNCVPALSDDVVINVPNIPGIIRISQIAYAKSLTLGGSGPNQFVQTLTVQGQLTVNGDVKIFPNGIFILDAAPSLPLTVSGLFDGTDRFTFNSGALNGTGTFSFTYVNFTGAALKAINASTTVSNLLLVIPGAGNQGTINIQSKQLLVNGNLTSSNSLNIYSNPGGILNVKGYFVYQGSSVTTSIIRGDAIISNLIATGGVLTLNDNVTITLANIGSGATLSLIGSGISTRSIGNIIGQGVLQVQGGTNVFNTFGGINSVLFQGGTLSTNSNTASISNLQQNGGILTGTGTISIGSVTLTNAQITNPTISVVNLNLQGFTGLSNAQLILTGMAVIGKDSQFTMSNGAGFTVSAAAKVSQSASFQLLPSGSNQPPTFTNNGAWTTIVGTLTVVVNTAGTGSFQFGTSSTLSLNGIAFNTQRVTLTGSKLLVTGSVATINTIDGTGNITAGGRQLFVSSIAVQYYNHTNGYSQIGSGTINNLDVLIGSLNVTGSSVNIGNLTFEGGEIAGLNPAGVVLTITNTTLKGHEPKTFVDIIAKSQNIELSCGTEQCQLFTQNAVLTTNMKKSYNFRSGTNKLYRV